MYQIIEYLTQPYHTYPNYLIFLELFATILGIMSVLLALREHIGVYPTGIISTAIYVYIFYKFQLFGEMTVNLYYTIMSFYGWYRWAHPHQTKNDLQINQMTSLKEWIITCCIFLGSTLFIYGLYQYFIHFHNLIKFNVWNDYVDVFTAAIFFTAMWLMATKKIENWILWIIGDIISIPLYISKGLGFTAIQYLVFTLIALMGYIEWKKKYKQYEH